MGFPVKHHQISSLQPETQGAARPTKNLIWRSHQCLHSWPGISLHFRTLAMSPLQEQEERCRCPPNHPRHFSSVSCSYTSSLSCSLHVWGTRMAHMPGASIHLQQLQVPGSDWAPGRTGCRDVTRQNANKSHQKHGWGNPISSTNQPQHTPTRQQQVHNTEICCLSAGCWR